MVRIVSEHSLGDQLTRWVAAGLIDAEQAARIRAAEMALLQPASGPTSALPADDRDTRPSAPVPALAPAASGRLGGRAPLVVEALGYLGGTLAVIAGFVAVGQLWPDIPTSVELAFAGTAAVLLGVVAAVMGGGDDPAFGRLRSVLRLMSTACLAAFVGLLAAQVWHFGATSAALVAAAAATGYAAVLWLRTPTPVQHLTLFAAAAVAVGTGIARLDPDLNTWGPGFGVWALSCAWGVAAHRGALRPRGAGYLAAAVGVLLGAQLTMEIAAGHVLALATVAALLAAGVALRKVWLLGVGALGVIQVVPMTAVRYLPPSLGAPLALFAVGLVLLGVALWLARWSKPRRSS